MVIARMRPAHLLLSLPCAIDGHEEDLKLDDRFKEKIVGVGDRVFAAGRSAGSEARR
jgi:hypothetical protein